MIDAAAITLDHGYRYFEIVGAEGMSANLSALPTIRPGTDVTIKVFEAGEVDPRPPLAWDAQAIAAEEVPYNQSDTSPLRVQHQSFARYDTTASISVSVMSLVLACITSLSRNVERKASSCFLR